MKVDEIKKQQGWRKPCNSPACRNCRFSISETAHIYCNVNGSKRFSTKLNAWCERHKFQK